MSYRALLIGNSVFDEDAGLNPLNAPVKDVARLHRALVDPETGLFDDDMVRLVTERTCDDILDELDRFFAAGRKDDLLLLYYSGHGVLDERNHLYLCGRDTRSDRLLRTAVSNVRVNEFVAQSMSQRTVILLDCCASGMFKGASVGPQLAGPGRFIVSSTRGANLANDAATATGTSLFTEHLVEGMLGAATDGNRDGYLDLRDIYDYVRDRLLAGTKQVPHCRFDGDATVSLARVRTAPQVLEMAAEGRSRSNEPTFALAENTITLRDVELDEHLAPEVVEVIKIGDGALDLAARSDDDWLQATASTDKVIVELRPRLGRNRGKVTVRDRNSNSAQVLRVEAHVHLAAAAAGASKSASPDAPPPRAEPTPERHSPTRDLPRPPRRQLVSPSWVGVGVAALGGLLLLIAFSGVAWYSRGDTTTNVHKLTAIASKHPDAGLAHAYFGGLCWLLILAVVAFGVAACLLTGPVSRILALVALLLGIVGIWATLTALEPIKAALRSVGYRQVGIFKYTSIGLWFALAGFVLAGMAGLFRRRSHS